VWGFAALWAGQTIALTLRAGRHQLPFGLTWWSFTFPVGTCVTGTSGLALHARWCPGPGQMAATLGFHIILACR
jgi:tellurite resistance protein TehA-like permease